MNTRAPSVYGICPTFCIHEATTSPDNVSPLFEFASAFLNSFVCYTSLLLPPSTTTTAQRRTTSAMSTGIMTWCNICSTWFPSRNQHNRHLPCFGTSLALVTGTIPAISTTSAPVTSPPQLAVTSVSNATEIVCKPPKRGHRPTKPYVHTYLLHC
jgi:hypothetical protein